MFICARPARPAAGPEGRIRRGVNDVCACGADRLAACLHHPSIPSDMSSDPTKTSTEDRTDPNRNRLRLEVGPQRMPGGDCTPSTCREELFASAGQPSTRFSTCSEPVSTQDSQHVPHQRQALLRPPSWRGGEGGCPFRIPRAENRAHRLGVALRHHSPPEHLVLGRMSLITGSTPPTTVAIGGMLWWQAGRKLFELPFLASFAGPGPSSVS